jgi:hypothetical protein
MTTSDLRFDPVVAAPTPAHARHTQVLASALAHLLGRDGEPPARWQTPAFAQAVEAARGRLLPVASLAELGRATSPGAVDLDFHEAARRLGRDPWDVALAIRRLELGSRRRLPAWTDLVRRGVPARPTDLETALWFG